MRGMRDQSWMLSWLLDCMMLLPVRHPKSLVKKINRETYYSKHVCSN